MKVIKRVKRVAERAKRQWEWTKLVLWLRRRGSMGSFTLRKVDMPDAKGRQNDADKG